MGHVTYPITSVTSQLTNNIASVQVKAVGSSAINESPFTFAQQVYEFTGKRWEFTVTTCALGSNTAALKAVQGFLLSLKGVRGTFELDIPDILNETASGSHTGTVTVNSGAVAGETNITLTKTGSFSPSQGDWICLTGATTAIPRLHKIASFTSSNMQMAIWPGLRENSTSETITLTTTNRKCRFRLADNEITWSKGIEGFTVCSFDIVEAL